MDSDELRRKRLEYLLGPQSVATEPDAFVSSAASELTSPQHQDRQESEASQPCPASFTSALFPSADGSTAANGTAVVVLTCTDAHAVLRSILSMTSTRQPAQTSHVSTATQTTPEKTPPSVALEPVYPPPQGTIVLDAIPSTSRCSDPVSQGQGLSPGMVIFSSSSDEDEQGEMQRPRKGPDVQNNWRESGILSASSSQRGAVEENKPVLPKRRGRPKGSKNRPKIIQDSDSDADVDGDLVSVQYISSDEEQPARHGRPRTENWRKALGISSSQRGAGKVAKGGPKARGHPRAAKVQKKSRDSNSPKDAFKCHICREGRDGNKFCTTDCGHLFHEACLDRWITSSSQRYRTNKTCPYCGGFYKTSIPFFG